MDNSAAPATLILTASSGIPSPNTLTCNGMGTGITVNPSAILTATEPPDGTNTRDRFASGETAVSTTTCTTGTCTPGWSFTNYAQVQNSYEAIANAQPNFDSGMTWALLCTQAGSSESCSFPSTVAASDLASFWTDYGRNVVFPSTSSGASSNSQWKISSDQTDAPTAGGNTYQANYYKQWETTFQTAAQAQPTFDSGLSARITGTSLGGTASICTITPTGGQRTGECSGFIDNGGTATFPPMMQGSGANVQWTCSPSPCTTQAVTSGGITLQASYYKQVSEKFEYSVAGGGTGYFPPSLVCTQFGTSGLCATLSTSPATFWLDYGSPWSVSNPLPGSTSSERWDSNVPMGTASAGSSLTISFYHQYAVSVKYVLGSPGSPSTAPTISYHLYEDNTTSVLSQSSTSFWMDAGQSFYLASIPGATGERWASQSSSFQATAGGSYTITLFNQYSLQLSYLISGGGTGYSAPTLTYTIFGGGSSASLSQTSSTYWADSGTGWSISDPLMGSGTTERWATGQTVAGTASSSTSELLTYYHQYLVSFSTKVVGGGVGYTVPSVSFQEFGNTVILQGGWADSGGTYVFTNPLSGSNSGERWYTGVSNGTIFGPGSYNATYYHQFAYNLDYSVIPTGPGYSPPQLNFTALSLADTIPLTTSQSFYWLDAGTSWSISAVLGGSGPTSRWATSGVILGSSLAPFGENLTYYRQYALVFAYSVHYGGSPPPPDVSYVTFGEASHATLSGGSSMVWADLGTPWIFPALLSNSGPEERWITNSTSQGTVGGPSTYEADYLHQYHLLVQANTALGGTFINSTNWYDSGYNVAVNASASAGWKFIYWAGHGPGSYNGTTEGVTFALSGPANETAVFYPGITISAYGGGHVVYSVGTLEGNVTGTEVVYIPLGGNVSLKAVPAAFDYIFLGWTPVAHGTTPLISLIADSPSMVTATFALDYSDIGVVSVAIPIIVILSIFVLVVRRWPRS
jgi:hypothetical protein